MSVSVEQLKQKYMQDVNNLTNIFNKKLQKIRSQRNINIVYKNNLI